MNITVNVHAWRRRTKITADLEQPRSDPTLEPPGGVIKISIDSKSVNGVTLWVDRNQAYALHTRLGELLGREPDPGV
jgi:hypothetical protein